jgi:hypothetical protein
MRLILKSKATASQISAADFISIVFNRGCYGYKDNKKSKATTNYQFLSTFISFYHFALTPLQYTVINLWAFSHNKGKN